MIIKEISIKRFRGIEDQTIKDINNALALIGKNNSGKSAILTAIRTLWNDYTPKDKDFYKNSSDFEIKAKLTCCDSYLEEFFLNSKIGFLKIPSTANEFNSIKNGTLFEDKSISDLKNARKEIVDNDLLEDVSTRDKFMTLWLNAIKNKFNIQNEILELFVSCDKSTMKLQHNNKDILQILPVLAFIDDTRNFDEEETGKAKSITSNIFNTILQTELINQLPNISCDNCNRNDCEDRCINLISSKSPVELDIEELQKLINYKTKNSSVRFTNSISKQFAKNYQNKFKVNIKATSNIDKSFSVITKIYDPALGSEIELSNVGAGVRSVYILSLLQTYQSICSKHTLFIIEEPELYLHPELQKLMAKTLSDISLNNQVVFTTHSPIMLKEFSSADIRKVKLDESNYRSEISVTTIDDILKEIGYSSQDVLNTDFVLFVEGPDDKEIIGYILEKYYDVNTERISIVDTKSCKNIGFYATLRFLEKTTISDEFAIIRDADTMSENIVKNILMNQLNSNLDSEFATRAISKTYITKFSSIEGYLFSPELLVSHNIYTNEEQVYERLKNKLTVNKDKYLQYYRKQNENEPERINLFESEYDSRISDPKGNIEWIKTNIKGHTYFGFTESERISYEKYVDELPIETFEDLIEFFDRISYFLNKKRT